jgi:hypothetical protein
MGWTTKKSWLHSLQGQGISLFSKHAHYPRSPPASYSGFLVFLWVSDRGVKLTTCLLVVSGTQDRGFKPGRNCRIFLAKKNPQHTFLQRGNKAVCTMSQICGMLKTPVNYVEVGFPGQICQPFLAHFRSSLPGASHVASREALLGSTGWTKGGAQRCTKLTA